MNYLQTDEQTHNDLSLFGKSGKGSILDLYNRTVTQGGSARMQLLFREPLNDADAINARAAIYRFFSSAEHRFPLDAVTMGAVAYYMENDDVRSQLQPGSQNLNQRFRSMIAADAEQVFVEDGVLACVRMFRELDRFLQEIAPEAQSSAYAEQFGRLTTMLQDRTLTVVYEIRENSKPGITQLADLDRLLRFDQRDVLLRILDLLYELDVHIAVGQTALKRGFHFAKAMPKDSGTLIFRQIYHPMVEKAIPNDLHMSPGRQVLFLTGANMAGKSTLMKSLGIALYLGHMGFPVAAEDLVFAVRDGLYTSINLSDNLQAGASHYYAEVLRVKEVAQELAAGKRLFVIFDELFRGTNVKDAYDATIAITRGFAGKQGSQFILSTHIMEAGEQLGKEPLSIQYQYLPTEMRGNTPVYTRVLREGITADRQGMVIIQNEGILAMLDEGLKSNIVNVKRSTMSFITDKQTLTDLNLLGKYKTGSLFNLFNRVRTRGGERLLEEMFRSPLSSAASINERTARIAYLQALQPDFAIDGELTEQASQYLTESRPAGRLSSYFSCYREKAQEVLYRSQKLYIQQKQVHAVQELLFAASHLLGQLIKKAQPHNPLQPLQDELAVIVNTGELKQLKAKYPYSVAQTAQYQFLFRNKHRRALERLLHLLYELDVYIAVAAVAADKGLQYASALAADASGNKTGPGKEAGAGPGSSDPDDDCLLLTARNLRHPSLSGAVGNDVSLTQGENCIFLTGANMAGKSTWMKTLGVSFYLAHMGFPLAADSMRFKVMEGIFTSINVPDDISLGWSHFYAEVMRVKTVAQEVSSGKKLFVLFDELFKGTNVKDAYDATLAVTEKLARYGSCAFVISTHIIEVGEALTGTPSIQFKYMPTVMEGAIPRYTYRLRDGITEDRQGMIIIENEKILEMLT